MEAEKRTLFPEQLFESQDTFIAHVKQFAMENGFNVRLDDVERDKGGTIRKRDIVCSSEGNPRGKESTCKREDSVARSDGDGEGPDMMVPSKSGVAHSGAHRRKSMKTGCRWLARASRQPSGMWKMILLRLEHNHPLAARYELLVPSAHPIRTGDSASISAAAQAARLASENGTYTGPSSEFKDLFLQMSAACADLCWSAARHPDTIEEVLGEIRRLNQHLDKHSGFELTSGAIGRGSGPVLPTISEDSVDHNSDGLTGDSEKTVTHDGSLVMMANGTAVDVDHRSAPAPSHPQPSHFLEVARATPSQHNGGVAQSPELNGTGNLPGNSTAGANPVSEAATSPTSATAADASAAATGPVKRARGRPRKNPISADSRPTKSRAQQKRDQQKGQQQQQQQQLAHVEPKATPTPAYLATLSHQIISQNSAVSSSANVQRSINSSLALPSKHMPVNSHPEGRPSMLTSNPTVPPIIDARSHLNPVQRQQQQPPPQPQQSPTFFLGAAEGNGYPKHSADPESAANVEYASSAAAAAAAYPGASAAMGIPAFHAPQKPTAASRPTAAATAAAATAASTTGVPKHATTATAAASTRATTDAPSDPSAVRRRRLPSSATTAVPPATTAVPRSTAISALSAPAANAPASMNLAISDERSRIAVSGTTSGLPMYQTYQHAHQQQQQQESPHMYYQRPQPNPANGIQSPAPANTINQLVLSSSTPVPTAAPPPQQQHHQQQGYSYQQQSNMFHLNPAIQATATQQQQVGRGSKPSDFDPYILMARAQQQQQQQQQHRQQDQQHANYHVQEQQQQATPSDHHFVDVGSNQSPVNTLSTLPPMAAHNTSSILPGTASRRFDGFQLNQYQNMNNWQV